MEHEVVIAREEVLEIVRGLFAEPDDTSATRAVDRIVLRTSTPARALRTAMDLLRASDEWHAAHTRREALRLARHDALASAWGLPLAAA